MRFSKNFYLSQIGSLRFICHHSILNQVAHDIAAGIPTDFRTNSRRINVICGVHHPMTLEWIVPGPKLAIQTEQFYDAKGDPLWSFDNKGYAELVRIAAEKADMVLDLSLCNEPLYEDLKIPLETRKKVFFGPHIFPSEPVAFNAGHNGHYIFYGDSGGDRRLGILQAPRDFGLEIVPNGIYGDRLSRIVSAARGVVNIHYHSGIYSESPRLLSAYLQGKCVLSEELSTPFEKNVHYGLLGKSEPENPERIFENFSQLVTQRFSFAKLIGDTGL